jgi:hypothetical protein
MFMLIITVTMMGMEGRWGQHQDLWSNEPQIHLRGLAVGERMITPHSFSSTAAGQRYKE